MSFAFSASQSYFQMWVPLRSREDKPFPCGCIFRSNARGYPAGAGKEHLKAIVHIYRDGTKSRRRKSIETTNKTKCNLCHRAFLIVRASGHQIQANQMRSQCLLDTCKHTKAARMKNSCKCKNAINDRETKRNFVVGLLEVVQCY